MKNVTHKNESIFEIFYKALIVSQIKIKKDSFLVLINSAENIFLKEVTFKQKGN